MLHVPSIKPVNKEEIVSASEKAKLVITVEEHTIYGGLGGMVAEILSEASPRKVVRFGIEDRWGESAPNDYLLDLFQMSPATLERANQKVGCQIANAATATIGVAFLGVGRMGETHLRNLVGSKRGASCRGRRSRMAEAAERGKALANAEVALTDIEKAIAHPGVDAVVIVTPTETHARLIEIAIKAGKAVFSEKPIALDFAETREWSGSHKRRGLSVQIGFMRRFDPGYSESQSQDSRRRIRQARDLSSAESRHVSAEPQVSAEQRRFVSGHGRARS